MQHGRDDEQAGAAAWRWSGLDADAARALLAPHLRDAALTPLGAGDFCLAFRTGNSVVRVARHAEAAAALARETCVLAAVAPLLPTPVPRPTLHAPPDCPPYTVHGILHGTELTRELWETLPLRAQRSVAADVVAFLQALHAVPPGLLQACALERLDDRATALRLCSSIDAQPLARLDTPTRAELARRLGDRAQHQQPPVLLHRDLAPGHVLVDTDAARVTGIIDFGDVALGDPARDFIYIYEDFGTALLRTVVAEYAGPAAAGFTAAVRGQYLLELTAWTVQRWRAGDHEEVQHALTQIERELSDA